MINIIKNIRGYLDDRRELVFGPRYRGDYGDSIIKSLDEQMAVFESYRLENVDWSPRISWAEEKDIPLVPNVRKRKLLLD